MQKRLHKRFAGHHTDTLAKIHAVVCTVREPQGVYWHASRIGNEGTAPLLLKRLRLDYGARKPVTPPQGFLCTHGHLIEAQRDYQYLRRQLLSQVGSIVGRESNAFSRHSVPWMDRSCG
jgi:hypothetical protein